MKTILRIWVLLAIPAIFNCCAERTSKDNLAGAELAFKPEYATGFEIYRLGNSSVLRIIDPWQGADCVVRDVFLSRDGEEPPAGFVGTVLEVPLKKVVCMSSSYIAYMDVIQTLDAVTGVSGARFISNETLRSRFENGELSDVGYDSNLDYELIAALAPDVVLAYGLDGENTALSLKLREMNIDIIYIGDYVEQSPLGKAEWTVAFGEMFDRRDSAIAFFEGVKNEYNATAKLVADDISRGRKKPVVMLNSPYRDVWYVPGDSSYMVRLIADAGGEYSCAGDPSERTRPLSGEGAFMAASRAQIWLNPGQVTSLAELVSENSRFSDIDPVVNKRVFNCNRRRTVHGGSDFWESGAVRADIVLKDMVRMLHPNLLPEHELYYFLHLE